MECCWDTHSFYYICYLFWFGLVLLRTHKTKRIHITYSIGKLNNNLRPF